MTWSPELCHPAGALGASLSFELHRSDQWGPSLIVARLLGGHRDEYDVAELRGAQHVEEEAVGVSRIRRQHLVEIPHPLGHAASQLDAAVDRHPMVKQLVRALGLRVGLLQQCWPELFC